MATHTLLQKLASADRMPDELFKLELDSQADHILADPIGAAVVVDPEDDDDLIWNLLSLYLPPLIILVGTVGNIYSFLIFTKLGRMKSVNFSFSFIGRILDFFRPSYYIRAYNAKRSNTHVLFSVNVLSTNRGKFETQKCSILRTKSTPVAQNSSNQLLKSYQTVNHNAQPTYKCKQPKASPSPSSAGSGLTVYLYLSLLALCDLGVLYFGLFNDWIIDLTQFDIKSRSAFVCKLLTFLGFLSSHCSSSLILVASGLRFIAVYEPLKASNLTNIKTFKIISASLFLFFFLVNLHLFWNLELVVVDDEFSRLRELISQQNPQLVSLVTQAPLETTGLALLSTQQQQQQAKANESSLSLLSQIMTEFELLNISEHRSKLDEAETPAGRYECRGKKNFFMLRAWPVIDKLFYCLIPFFFIIVCNLLIIRNISKAEKVCQVLKLKISYTNKKPGAPENNNNNNNRPNQASLDGKQQNDLKKKTSYEAAAVKGGSGKKAPPVATAAAAAASENEGYDLLKNSQRPNEFLRERKKQLKKYHLVNRRFTIMLLSLSFAFLLLTLPVVIMYLLLEYFNKEIESMDDLNKSTAGYEWLRSVQKSSSLLMYLNHSINFFLYFATGSRFRQQFYRTFNFKCVSIKIKPNACMDIKKNVKNIVIGQNHHQKQMELKLKSSLYD